MTFGQRLRLAREHAGLSQDELGERSGVSQKTISKLEGGRQAKSSKTVELATVCGVREPWLSRESGPMLEIQGYAKNKTQEGDDVRQYDSVTTAIAVISEAMRPDQRSLLLKIATQLLTTHNVPTGAEKGGS